ncbi:PaaI family thioesterase [Amycolatopsis acidiphila]|uniref:Acyl-coenzyme A thioesterase THEM4 n=2 Tax=Amycolatopsis acidiphila TaxID=715473 RepID=A0A558ACM7_9PSEU|nr:PaaI family thioesterase [Amycolatopsis acidiphila]
MIEALRSLQARVTGAAPPPETVTDVAEALEKLAATLEPFTVGERDQIAGHRGDLPGRGQAMSPVLHVDEWDGAHVLGRITFSRFYLGGNWAVHGGAIPLAFDEVLGRLASTGRTAARTAYLHVNYRKITPIEVELRVEAKVDRVEGRKRFLTGALYDGEHLTADAEGLFVELRPGQP